MNHAYLLAILVASVAACGSGSTGDLAPDAGGGGDSGGSNGCHSNADCSKSSFESCARVEDPVCGGYHLPPQCAQDKDCADAGNSEICVSISCGQLVCRPKCTGSQDCGTALDCSPTTGQCVAKACGQSPDCPMNYECASQMCAPKSCMTDADCVGFCVDNVCSSAIGTCRSPAP